MTAAGIEALNLYGGAAALDLDLLAARRGLDPARFAKLLMREKTVALPYEDPVTYAVNAAKPLIDALPPEERRSVEMLITCSESGIDFGKSLSTYVLDQLGLGRNCRLFEVKQACYSGAVGLQTAVNFVLSRTSPGGRALVIATDIARFAPSEIAEWAYSEPSSGSGAVAMLVSERPHLLRIDPGAYGVYGFEVMDTCRPGPNNEAGDADLSLMAYLDCCQNAWEDYARRVEGADFRQSFRYLAFHTPFGGMVKGAHRQLMRKLKARSEEIEADFERRLRDSLRFGARVGNTAGASMLVALARVLEHAELQEPARIKLFSYGSGCCSEFFSGVSGPEAQARLRALGIPAALDARHRLTMEEYEALLHDPGPGFGTKDVVIDPKRLAGPWAAYQRGRRLALTRIEGYHRRYEWVGG